MAVLTCLLGNAGQVVSQETLLQLVWKGQVVEPTTVPRNIAAIRRALGDDPREPRYIETIPKRGYRVVAQVRAAQPGDIERPSASHDLTLAVLPFDSLSSEPEVVYFSDGLSEEILETVATSTAVKVIGRTSSFRFRGEEKVIRRVAQSLGCSHVLDGSVRRSVDRIRISAHLIECARETTVWSDHFDRDLEDVLSLQDDVAAAVASALDVTFRGGSNRGGTVDPAVFDLYLQAKAGATHWLGACDGHLLEQAVAGDPDFSSAWSALAVTRAVEAHLERDANVSDPCRRQAIKAARQALRLDPGSSPAYAALSIVEPVCGRFQERRALIAEALRVQPTNAISLFWASRWSWAEGRLQEALDYIARACAVEPLWPEGLHQYATMLWTVGRDEEAESLWDRLTRDWPDREYLWGVPIVFNSDLGNWAKVEELTARLAASGLTTEMLQYTLRRAKLLRNWSQQDTDRLARRLSEQVARTGTITLNLHLACRVGLTDHVYTLLDRASFDHLFEPSGRVVKYDYGLHHLFTRFTAGEAMYRDRRFVRLCARLGLCDYWVGTSRWPDCADDLSRYYDFRQEAHRYVA